MDFSSYFSGIFHHLIDSGQEQTDFYASKSLVFYAKKKVKQFSVVFVFHGKQHYILA